MLSVVIPCKNEGESIYAVVHEIQHKLNRAGILHEIIVVDNNSTDSTVVEAQKAGSNIVITPCAVPGYGAAIMHGIRVAHYNLIAMLDGDGSYNPDDIIVLFKLAKDSQENTLYIGNRFASKDTSHIKFLNRIIGVPFLNFITNKIYRATESFDSHCGLRIFSKHTYEALKLTHTDFSFANEMVCKALKYKIPIIQKPIILRKDLRIHTTSKIKLFRDGYYALKTILSLRF